MRFGSRLIVGALLLSAIMHWVVDPADVVTAFRSLDTGWWLLALLLMPVGVAVQWWKWRILVRTALPTIDDAQVTRSLWVGFSLGLVTPGRLGELGRGALWSGHRRQAVALAALDRTMSAAVTVTLGGFSLSLYQPTIAAALLLLAVPAGVFGIRRLAKWSALEVLRQLPSSAWRSNLVGAVAFNLLFIGQMALFLDASGNASMTAMLALPMMFALKTLLPISFLDLGVREGAAIAVLSLCGVPAAAAVQASLLLFCCNVLLPGLAGWLILARQPDTDTLSHPQQGVHIAHVR